MGVNPFKNQYIKRSIYIHNLIGVRVRVNISLLLLVQYYNY